MRESAACAIQDVWRCRRLGRDTIDAEGLARHACVALLAKEGKYEVSVEASVEGGEKAQSELTVNAGTYGGVETCASCHNGAIRPDVYSAWRATGHGTKLETTYAQYTAERDYCIGCHTTGYNETAANGGFDDLARAGGWNPAEGSAVSWLLAGNRTLEQIQNSPMGELVNVQCESCHGPGSVHTRAKSYDPGVRQQCHQQGSQWANVQAVTPALPGFRPARDADAGGFPVAGRWPPSPAARHSSPSGLLRSRRVRIVRFVHPGMVLAR